MFGVQRSNVKAFFFLFFFLLLTEIKHITLIFLFLFIFIKIIHDLLGYNVQTAASTQKTLIICRNAFRSMLPVGHIYVYAPGGFKEKI